MLAPITSQSEADQVRGRLIQQLAFTHRIDEAEAGRRLDALQKSGILAGGKPSDPTTQQRIDAFLSIPSEKYAHLS